MVTRGDVLGGRYVIERILGQGGMGLVVAARHVELGQRVAIKMLLASEHHDREILRRFERESRSVAELSSEHVARVTDIGTFEDGSPFMVMEYLEGEDLQARISREGPLGIALAVRLLIQAAIGLGDAHDHGVVHRDVKPSNLFLTRRRSGRIVLKVLDFGIAKADDEPIEASMTRISSLIGSPQYMSPEQLCDPRAVDARTDIWALGAAFYEAIAGCVAFPADSLPELHVKVLAFEPPDLASLRADCPPELACIVHRCLSKDVSDRFESMGDLQRALEALEASGVVDALPPESGPLLTVGDMPAVTLPPPVPLAVTARLEAVASRVSRFRGSLVPPSLPRGADEAAAAAMAPAPAPEAPAPGASSAEPTGPHRFPWRSTMASACVAAIVASVTTFILVRTRVLEGDRVPPHATAGPLSAVAMPAALGPSIVQGGSPCVVPSASDGGVGSSDAGPPAVEPPRAPEVVAEPQPAAAPAGAKPKGARSGRGRGNPSGKSSAGADRAVVPSPTR